MYSRRDEKALLEKLQHVATIRCHRYDEYSVNEMVKNVIFGNNMYWLWIALALV